MNSPWHSVTLEGNGNALVRIDGTVGNFGDDGEETLRTIQDAKTIRCVIRSGGGDSKVAVRWFDFLVERNTTVHVVDRACSAAAIIALAGRTRTIAENAAIMIHAPMRAVLGNIEQLQFAADCLKPLRERFAQIISERTKQCRSVVDSWLAGADVWLTAEQALAAGLVHGILPQPATPYQLERAADVRNGCVTDTEQERLCFDLLRAMGKIEVRDQKRFINNLIQWALVNATQDESASSP